MRKLSTAIALTALITGCLAGEPTNGPECNEADEKPCPSGFACVEFRCWIVCADSDDCGPAEACSGAIFPIRLWS